MPDLHMRLDGTWAVCTARVRACPRKFHVPNMRLVDLRYLPDGMFQQLIASLDPPSVHVGHNRTALWQDAGGHTHRDHDLPAEVGPLRTAWFRHGNLHRDYDRPALLEFDGDTAWYQHGKMHRVGGPAHIEPDGTQTWYDQGMKHRDGGPAQVEADGTELWYQHGRLHRADDLPAVSGRGRQREWWHDGLLHREAGPAVIAASGTQRWYWLNRLHREGDEPAVIDANGNLEWWTHGSPTRLTLGPGEI